ncbi:MAG: histidine phosphatase family protein [Candidatus Microsaccharimonas sossegonensis]|uniref:Histidine phosphatase family protein n=1 Tax=Candidatus Microsaccharimonas sossegonensis TaxID=2506948 RepID=A0A4Q0AGW1_9BACT|nr:MAG: histidine phosphatase family protein [Candidatus Microsaccharimonas sossegonensis]
MLNKRIYFIRHGQSIDDELKIFQSYSSGLSDLGKNQVKAVSHELTNGSYDSLVSSPMQRAKDGAEIIAGTLHIGIQYSDLFVESMRPTEIEGKPRSDENARKLQREWKQTLCTVKDIHVSDGENYTDILLRAKRALLYLDRLEGSNIVVVTHGYFLRTIIAYILFGDNLTPSLLKIFKIIPKLTMLL